MPANQQTVDELLAKQEGQALEWLTVFVSHMRKTYPQLEEVVSFQMPTYRLGEGANRHYISFSVAKEHFSLHTMDFDYIVSLRERLKTPGKGKGCVNVKYTAVTERDVLFAAIDEIVARTNNA